MRQGRLPYTAVDRTGKVMTRPEWRARERSAVTRDVTASFLAGRRGHDQEELYSSNSSPCFCPCTPRIILTPDPYGNGDRQSSVGYRLAGSTGRAR
jgi:hypothetical protein